MRPYYSNWYRNHVNNLQSLNKAWFFENCRVLGWRSLHQQNLPLRSKSLSCASARWSGSQPPTAEASASNGKVNQTWGIIGSFSTGLLFAQFFCFRSLEDLSFDDFRFLIIWSKLIYGIWSFPAKFFSVNWFHFTDFTREFLYEALLPTEIDTATYTGYYKTNIDI